MEIVRSGEDVAVVKQDILPTQRRCVKCDYISSQELCQACRLLSGLNKDEAVNGDSTNVGAVNGKANGGGGCGGECACSEKALDF